MFQVSENIKGSEISSSIKMMKSYEEVKSSIKGHIESSKVAIDELNFSVDTISVEAMGCRAKKRLDSVVFLIEKITEAVEKDHNSVYELEEA